jgi:hypothetical protein
LDVSRGSALTSHHPAMGSRTLLEGIPRLRERILRRLVLAG